MESYTTCSPYSNSFKRAAFSTTSHTPHYEELQCQASDIEQLSCYITDNQL